MVLEQNFKKNWQPLSGWPHQQTHWPKMAIPTSRTTWHRPWRRWSSSTSGSTSPTSCSSRRNTRTDIGKTQIPSNTNSWSQRWKTKTPQIQEYFKNSRKRTEKHFKLKAGCKKNIQGDNSTSRGKFRRGYAAMGLKVFTICINWGKPWQVCNIPGVWELCQALERYSFDPVSFWCVNLFFLGETFISFIYVYIIQGIPPPGTWPRCWWRWA